MEIEALTERLKNLQEMKKKLQRRSQIQEGSEEESEQEAEAEEAEKEKEAEKENERDDNEDEQSNSAEPPQKKNIRENKNNATPERQKKVQSATKIIRNHNTVRRKAEAQAQRETSSTKKLRLTRSNNSPFHRKRSRASSVADTTADYFEFSDLEEADPRRSGEVQSSL